MKAMVLYTGGKDSHYAIIAALREGVEVVVLVVVVPRKEDSWMFHTVNVEWARLHSESMGIPIEFIEVSGEKEVEVHELYRGLRQVKDAYGADTIVTGAIASIYQKKRVDRVAERLSIKHYAPLWGLDQERVLRMEVEDEVFMITAVQAHGLTSRWLGKAIDRSNVDEFIRVCRRHMLSPVGEGGEIETFVLDSSIMRKKVSVVDYEKKWFPAGFGYLIIRNAILEDKP